MTITTVQAAPPTPQLDLVVRKTPYRATYLEMLISGVLGLVAALVLSADAVVLAANPKADLACNISSYISCGTVGLSWQANLFGFPNAFLGLIAEPVLIVVSVAALSGVRFPRGFMLAAQAVYTIGLGFAYWLFYQAYFNIKALCPWCLAITVTTTLVWFGITRVNILDGHLGKTLQRRLAVPLRYNLDTAAAVIILAGIAAMVVYRYL